MATADGGRLPVLVTSSGQDQATTAGPLLDPHAPCSTPATAAPTNASCCAPARRPNANASGCQRLADRRCSAVSCPPQLPTIAGWRPPPTTTPPPRTRSAATSTTSSPWPTDRGASSSATCAARAPRPPRVTSLIRYTLRAAAAHDPDPVHVLTTLNTRCSTREPADNPASAPCSSACSSPTSTARG